MPSQVVMQNDKKVKVFTIDQKEENSRRKQANELALFTKRIRNSGLNVSRVILAEHDPDVSTFFPIPMGKSSEYALVEIFGEKNWDPKKFKLEIKKAQGFLAATKVSVAATKEFYNGDYPVCKIVCKIK